MDFNEAQELLQNAAANDPSIPGYEGGPTAGEQEQSNSAEQSPSQGPSDEQGAAGNADTGESFTPINPDDLPEELQPLAKQLQGAFTRKTQELAELRKSYEAFGDADPRQVLEAYQFAQALQTDPRVAMQVHQELSQVLQAQGFMPAQADAQAAQMMQGNQSQPQGDDFDMSWMDDESGFGVPPEIQQELAEMHQFRQQFAEQQAQMQFEQQIAAQHNAIQQQHPEYGESDYDRIYKIAATTGDLISAEREYAGWKDEMIASFLKDKRSVPAATPAQTGPAQVPQQGFQDLFDPNLEAAVQERLRAIEGM